ncbi:ribose-1,5-bisphosphate isomerase, e2b2 family [Aciduliprofundum sp. MAR08-339]|uniref:ribose 1,5-bisphosphate isomerase n=1 Tax=Aciduliprofundum sp. (strain MAR08-339) TaxID=673860 RepID=UPI0002A4B513|nr:ribose-1,5-bisphosphate isomerase, e2b2 family [Aciduliprofundum sp. MAR08-339]
MYARVEDIGKKIKSMEIRGAGRIGRAAALALKYFAEDFEGNIQGFYEDLDNVKEYLISTRPTAVSLKNAVYYVVNRAKGENVEDLRKSIIKNAEDFIKRSEEALEIIGKYGAGRIPDGATILTHCNSSAALQCIIQAHRDGKKIRVFNTETRPWLQGHITARALAKEGIDVTMIVDSAVRYFMRDVDIVVVGADTIASNGAVINKIGTSQIALAAHEARVPFIVCAETYKFSPETVIGKLVKIEERDPREIANPDDFPGVKFRNPVFDATPPEYIDAIVTEKGVISPYLAYEIIKEVMNVGIEGKED